MVDLVALQAVASPTGSSKALRVAAEIYKMDVGAITTKVKQEFATKDKGRKDGRAEADCKGHQEGQGSITIFH